MLKTPNKLKWPICPHCTTEINGYQFFPASVLTNRYGQICECPKCKKKIGIEMRTEIVFEAFEIGERDEQ